MKIENKKVKALILYHSGAGSTKFVAEMIKEKLSDVFEVELNHINSFYDNKKLDEYELVVLGFPTHHAEPSLSMKEYIDALSSFVKSKKAFIYTTYGLYPGNSLRIFAKQLQGKNFQILAFEEFKAPASDGVLLFSDKLRFMFQFEKEFNDKLNNFTEKIENYKDIKPNTLPPYKWYVPLNDLIKPVGEKIYKKYRHNMHIDAELCTNCNLCVKVCDRNAWSKGENTPSFDVEKCEFCLECVHKCPEKAIVFTEKMKDKPRLNRKFFKKIKETFSS